MPEGAVRKDLNKTGVSYRGGNPIPPGAASDNSNPVTWVKSPAHFGNPEPPVDATFASNPVTWVKSPTHFGNTIGGSFSSASGFLLENGTGVVLLEDGSILLLEVQS